MHFLSLSFPPLFLLFDSIFCNLWEKTNCISKSIKWFIIHHQDIYAIIYPKIIIPFFKPTCKINNAYLKINRYIYAYITITYSYVVSCYDESFHCILITTSHSHHPSSASHTKSVYQPEPDIETPSTNNKTRN